MVTLKIHVGGDSFEIETDAPLSEVTPLVDQWYQAIAKTPPPVIHGDLVFDPPTEQPSV